MSLTMIPVAIVEYDLLTDWVHRIKSATICCNNEEICKVVEEIAHFYHITEGNTIEQKYFELQERKYPNGYM